MNKHTPGPWYMQRTGAAPRVRQEVTRILICKVDGGEVGAWNDNAALIAAAPELLEALKQANDTLKYLGNLTGVRQIPADELVTPDGLRLDEILTNQDAAIAKAEGR